MKKIVLILMLLLLLTAAFTGCTHRTLIEGNHDIDDATVTTEGGEYSLIIENINTHSSLFSKRTLKLYTGAQYKDVMISTDSNILETVKAEVDETAKTITISGRLLYSYNPSEMDIYVGVPLKDVTVNGAYELDIKSDSTAFSITINGACSGKIQLDSVEDFSLTVNGASNLTLNGKCVNHIGKINGAASIDALNLESDHADITLNGAASYKLYAAATLKAQVNGVGSIKYIGDAVLDKQIEGVGKVEKID